MSVWLFWKWSRLQWSVNDQASVMITLCLHCSVNGQASVMITLCLHCSVNGHRPMIRLHCYVNDQAGVMITPCLHSSVNDQPEISPYSHHFINDQIRLVVSFHATVTTVCLWYVARDEIFPLVVCMVIGVGAPDLLLGVAPARSEGRTAFPSLYNLHRDGSPVPTSDNNSPVWEWKCHWTLYFRVLHPADSQSLSEEKIKIVVVVLRLFFCATRQAKRARNKAITVAGKC